MAAAVAFLTTDRGVTCSTSVTITSDGFKIETAVSESFEKWAGIFDILDVGNYVYVRLSQSRFLGIPRGSFATDAECDAFVALLRRRFDAARGRVPA